MMTSKAISRRTHAKIDLATVAIMLLGPRLLGANRKFTRASTFLALAKLGQTLFSRHEMGAAPLLPMKSHLMLDLLGGATMMALPSIVNERNKKVVAFSKALAITELSLALTTSNHSIPARLPGVSIGVTTRLPGENKAEKRLPLHQRLPEASLVDSLKVNFGVIAPTVAMGPIIRRPKVMGFAESLDFAGNAAKILQELKEKYGEGPLMIKLPFRHQAVLLSHEHVRRVLNESPDVFATASVEKQAALAHFEPEGALISHGPERAARRELNEKTLETDSAVHHMAGKFVSVVKQEAKTLIKKIEEKGELSWEEYYKAWFCIVRRVVFGDSARDDTRITELMEKLRSHGNWAFLKPVNTELRDELHHSIRQYLKRSETGSLVSWMAEQSPTEISSPENQIPQWLFAFDPAAMASFRALGLLALHPDKLNSARNKNFAASDNGIPNTFLRATMLESLRLWPTTPMILRQSTRETKWGELTMPAHTGILIYAPFFHRDHTTLSYAHSFNPDFWLSDDPEAQGRPPEELALVPFSGGPAICPGRNVVLMLAGEMLACLLREADVQMEEAARYDIDKLPGVLNNYKLHFSFDKRSAKSSRVNKDPDGLKEQSSPV